MRKAQVSLEYMLVMLALLTFLTIWFSSILKTQTAVNTALKHSETTLLVDKLSEAINSVCLMGSGNKRVLKIFSSEGLHVVMNNTHITIGNFTKRIYCKVNSIMELSGTVVVTVKNANGEIQVNVSQIS